MPQKCRAYPSALTAVERERIATLVKEQWSLGNSVSEAFIRAWDNGEYLGSLRSWYRVAAGLNQQLRPVGPSRQKRNQALAPIVEATRPGQVWVWDITDLHGPFKGTRFKAYCAQDLYSRMIMAHCVQHREEDKFAVEMFERSFGIEGIPEHLHADNGAAMRSDALGELCNTLNVTMSFNRPSVSNDNPFKESEFRTMKHRPNYPGLFHTIEEARAWLDEYTTWFNREHHHSALAWHTPGSVADGSWEQVQQNRAEVLDQHYQAHPYRYASRPQPRRPAEIVGINLHRKPEHTKTTNHCLQTA